MELLLANVDLILVVVGSVLGSVKASVEFNEKRTCLQRAIDIALGVFIGTAGAYHYGSEFSIWLKGLIALIGGVSGALVLEVFMQLLPSLAKKFIVGIADKFR